MSKYQELKEKINLIQEAYKELKEYPLLCELKDPGTTSFVCKEYDILICPLDVPQRKRTIDLGAGIKPDLTDFMGVDPFIALVMESSAPNVTAGDVVFLRLEDIAPNQQGQVRFRSILIDGGSAIAIPAQVILGIDKSLSVANKE